MAFFLDLFLCLTFFLDPKCHQRRCEEFEFSVISHVDDDFIYEKIPKYCSKNKRKILLQLKRGQYLVGRDKLLLKSREYFEQQLKGIIDEDVYSMPYVDDNSIHPNVDTPFLTIMNTLKSWCYGNNKNEGKMKGLVICGYNLDTHLKFLNFSNTILENYCFNLSPEELHEESDKLIITYNPAEKVIFLIRRANTDNLQNEMKLSTNDVMKFVLLHFDILKNSGIQVINLLVTDKEIDVIPLVCESCKHQVISMESFKSPDHFQSWWEIKHEKFSISLCYQNINANFSEDFCAQLLFFFATHEIQRKSQFDGMLPLKTDYLREQVEEANFLTYEQLRIIYSKFKHQMVFGWYDSGISTVAQKRAEVISSRLNSNEILCFICYDSKSQLLVDKENNPKMKLILNENFMNLSDIVKGILEDNENKQKIHLMAVEYDTEELNNSQTKELREMFTRNEKLKDSYIFLGCQPIQKERTVKIMGKQYTTQIELKLYDKLCMKKEELNYSKRNTSEINALIVFTANQLEDETAICELSSNNAVGAKTLFKAQAKMETKAHDHSVTKSKLGREKVGKDVEGENKNLFKKITFDETFELYNMDDSVSSRNKASNRDIVKSGFRYIIKPSKSEFNVKLVKPSIVEIKYTEDSKEHMIINLKKILGQIICHDYRDHKDYDILKPCKSEKHVILHFDIQNDFPQYFNMVFQLMGKEQKVTNNYKEFIRDEDKTILVCNYRTFRGLKNSSVIVVLEPSLYHLKFCVLECLSRATVVLDVIVLNIGHTGKRKKLTKTFQSTINKWKSLSKSESLFSPCKFIDCERQNSTDRNTPEEASKSEDMRKIRKWFTESKSQISYNETDLSHNLAR